jgi:hypothetical protein
MRRGVKIFGGVVVVLVGLYVWPFLVPLPQRTTEPIVPPFPAEYGAAAVADLEAAETRYREGAFQAAYDLWKPLAEAGNPEAQFRIGRLYDRGELFAQDEDEGLRWFQLAADQGHALALSSWAAKLMQAGADLCDPKVQELTRAAAEAGAPISQFNLSVSLGAKYNCFGAIEGSPEELQWLKRSANQGDIQANALLSLEYAYRKRPYDNAEKFYFRFLISAEEKDWGFPISHYLYSLMRHEDAEQAAMSRYLKWRPVQEVRLP